LHEPTCPRKTSLPISLPLYFSPVAARRTFGGQGGQPRWPSARRKAISESRLLLESTASSTSRGVRSLMNSVFAKFSRMRPIAFVASCQPMKRTAGIPGREVRYETWSSRVRDSAPLVFDQNNKDPNASLVQFPYTPANTLLLRIAPAASHPSPCGARPLAVPLPAQAPSSLLRRRPFTAFALEKNRPPHPPTQPHLSTLGVIHFAYVHELVFFYVFVSSYRHLESATSPMYTYLCTHV